MPWAGLQFVIGAFHQVKLTYLFREGNVLVLWLYHIGWKDETSAILFYGFRSDICLNKSNVKHLKQKRYLKNMCLLLFL